MATRCAAAARCGQAGSKAYTLSGHGLIRIASGPSWAPSGRRRVRSSPVVVFGGIRALMDNPCRGQLAGLPVVDTAVGRARLGLPSRQKTREELLKEVL